MSIFRKAYSVAGAVLMLQFLLQLYLISAAIFTIVNANDNAKDVYAAFKNADSIVQAHRGNGDLALLTILVMVGCSFGARYPWRTTILTGVLLVLLIVQSLLGGLGTAPFVEGLHGVNALILIGLGGYLTSSKWAFRRTTAQAPTAS
jgi:Family of unknown function (DUF6220)